MTAVSAQKLKKHILGPLFRVYWSKTKPLYAGYNDPEYELLTEAQWRQLRTSAPQVGYVTNIYDCEDIAMEFKVHVARTQSSNDDDSLGAAPFAVGIAVGNFYWLRRGRALHAANFAILNSNGSHVLEWFDLRTRKVYPFAQIRRGLLWTLI